MIAVHLAPYLRRFAGGAAEVEVEHVPGGDVRAALAALFAHHPGLRDRVLTEPGEVRPHVNVFVGEESIRAGAGLATPLSDGAALWILAAVSGG